MTRQPKKESIDRAKALITGGGEERVSLKAPDLRVATFHIVGTAPYVQNKFSNKAREMMKQTQMMGSQAKTRKVREPKDFDAVYRGAMHLTEDGKYGIPANAFRSALISVCRLIGFKMVLAKLSVFVLPDGFDADDGTPLVFINGEPVAHETVGRNDNGSADIRVRPMWREWSADVRVRFDADQFSHKDVANLLMRVGMQAGVGEGRPDSKNSGGIGWGTFELEG